jgi:hypothetical protein
MALAVLVTAPGTAAAKLESGTHLASAPDAHEDYLCGGVVSAADPAEEVYANRSRQPPSPRADHLLFAILFAGLAIMVRVIRRERSPRQRVRLAAMAAMASLLFACATAAMPWFSVDSPIDGDRRLECNLGDEAACAATVPDLPGAGMERAADLADWMAVADALRLGLLLSLFLLLPALNWSLVAPRNMAAHAVLCLGAGAAVFSAGASQLYLLAAPGWLDLHAYWTADVASLCAVAIAIAAVVICRAGFEWASGPAVPSATAHFPVGQNTGREPG